MALLAANPVPHRAILAIWHRKVLPPREALLVHLDSVASPSSPVTPWQLVRSSRSFRLLWAAQLVSMCGDSLGTVALSSLLFARSGRATDVSLLLLATNLPFLLTAPFSGVLADRLDRKRLMLGCDLSRAVLALLLLVAVPREGIWLPLALVFGIETLSSLFDPASSAALPNLVQPHELAAANALSSASFGVTLAAGAALGGWITHSLGAPAALMVNALTFLVSAVLLGAIQVPFSEAARTHGVASGSGSPWLADFRQGLALVVGDTRLLSLLSLKVFWGLGTGVLTLLTVMPMQVFGAGSSGVALLYGMRGAGALCGPLLAQHVLHHVSRPAAQVACWGIASTGACYLAFATSGSLAAAACWVLLAHIGSGLVWVTSTSQLQAVSADGVRGRIMALDYSLVMTSMAVSSAIYGKATDQLGARQVGVAGGLVLLALALAWGRTFRHAWQGKAAAPPECAS